MTAYHLKIEPQFSYSKGERKIFGLLAPARRSSADIAERYYRPLHVPMHGRKIIIGLMNSIRRKVVLNKEPFRIMASPRKGPNSIFFWVEKVK